MATNNNVLKKNWKILLLLGSFSVIILGLITSMIWFFGYRTIDNISSLNYNDNHYYSTAYFYPNLSNEGKETAILGDSTYIGHYKNKELNLNTESKLWKIKDIPQNKLIVEMTPNGHSASFVVWEANKLKNIKEAFDFFNPQYLSYATYNNEQLLTHQADKMKQSQIIQEVRKIIQGNPSFTTLSTVDGTSINEIYFNESINQSLVLQASLLDVPQKGTYMHFSGEMGRIGYWQVSDSLLNLLQ